MAGDEHLLAAIEAVHAAGLDVERWPQALAAVARAVEGVGASLETFDRAPLAPRELYTFGMPPAAQLEYFNHYAAINPRWALITRQKAGELGWDYRILDQAAIKRSPFYMEFLKTIDFPFFVYGMVAANDKEFTGIAVHRSRRQGHVERAGIVRLERLLPHARQAFDVARRLKGLNEARHSLERALDWLADGVVLVRADGAITYANLSFQVIARGKDGIGTWKGVVELSSAGARDRFAAALQAVGRLRDGDVRAAAVDFPVARPSGAPAYLVSVRPLLDKGRAGRMEDVVAIVFVRDPLGRNVAAASVMRDVFGLTESEAHLAQALQSGVPIGNYARDRALSLNTVYTHLRRLKEKTGCHRMPELIRKLNDLQVSLRTD